MKLPLATSAAITTIIATSILDPSTTAPAFAMPFRQYSTAADIPQSSIKNNKVIAGRVVK